MDNTNDATDLFTQYAHVKRTIFAKIWHFMQSLKLSEVYMYCIYF